MEASDFTDQHTGRLVPTVSDSLAFVPAPIPRSLQLAPSIIRLLARAENALGGLNGTTGRLVSPWLVGSPLLHREALLSSKIEGTVTTPEELVLFEVGGAADRPGPSRVEDTQEVANYMAAMHHGLGRLRELPVCLRLIREVHEKLLTGVRGNQERPGEFRTTQNWIGRPGDPIARARFVPPPPTEMNAAMNELERYLNTIPGSAEDDLPLLVQLALVHYQFEAIHPFRDGNGRIGRLLIPLLLCSHARLDEPLLYLSAYFEQHRDEYYDQMLSVSQRGTWLNWIQFFLQGVEACAQDAKTQAEALLALRARYHGNFQSARSSALLLKLIDELFKAPSITIGKAAALLEVTPAAASANIRKLVAAGILIERTGRQRDQKFVAKEILSFMEMPAASASGHRMSTATPEG